MISFGQLITMALVVLKRVRNWGFFLFLISLFWKPMYSNKSHSYRIWHISPILIDKRRFHYPNLPHLPVSQMDKIPFLEKKRKNGRKILHFFQLVNY